MHLRPKWFRHAASIIFTVYYLVCADQADEKVRRVRGGLTLQHLRVSWDKPRTPCIRFFNELSRPKRITHRYLPRELQIRRPDQSQYTEPIHAWLYFDGPLSALRNHDKVILDVPGGGFVAMDPRCHDDKLFAWAGKSGLPLLALDYRKAPEYPYPYALNECFDVYHMIHATRGQCIGLSGEFTPKVVVSGDSAGANLAVGMVLMILQTASTTSHVKTNHTSLPPPEGCVLVYPSLDMNIGNWMTDEQMALIKDRRMRKTNRGVLRRKSDDYRKLDPETPHASEDEDDDPSPPAAEQILNQPSKNAVHTSAAHTSADHTVDGAAVLASKPMQYRTRLAMSSMISYFNDRILTPEMMRAMIVLYIGPHNRPDFSTDFFLSPLLAPEALLAKFPKTYMLTGERDPLVDDTVIFAGRLRQAKLGVWRERKELGLVRESDRFDESQHVNVVLIPGISHGFLQFVSVFPEGWKYILRARRWMVELFREAELREQVENERRNLLLSEKERRAIVNGQTRHDYFGLSNPSEHNSDNITERSEARHHRRAQTGSSCGDEDQPLEMSTLSSTKSSTRQSDQNTLVGIPERKASLLKGDNRQRPPAALRPVPARNHKSQLSGTFSGFEHDQSRSTSYVSLSSADDLLGRRMKGLTGALMGESKDLMTP